MRVKASASKAKPAPAVETSASINAQIEAFLKSGGEIQEIKKFQQDLNKEYLDPKETPLRDDNFKNFKNEQKRIAT